MEQGGRRIDVEGNVPVPREGAQTEQDPDVHQILAHRDELNIGLFGESEH
jgi:hypothetical protein